MPPLVVLLPEALSIASYSIFERIKAHHSARAFVSFQQS